MLLGEVPRAVGKTKVEIRSPAQGPWCFRCVFEGLVSFIVARKHPMVLARKIKVYFTVNCVDNHFKYFPVWLLIHVL